MTKLIYYNYIKKDTFDNTYDPGIIYSDNNKTIINNIDCNNILPNFTIPNTVNTINMGAFQGCDKLKSIIIPSNVNSIVKNAFLGSGLTTAIINNNVIGESQFANCIILHILPFHVLTKLKCSLYPDSATNKVDFINIFLIIPKLVTSLQSTLDKMCFKSPISPQGMLIFGALSSAYRLLYI